MSPIQWAVRPLRKYADFTGRAPRAEYWWYALIAGIVGFVVGLLDVRLIGPPIFGSYGPFGLTFVAALFTPGLAVTVRRLHDSGHSGWWSVMRLIGFALALIGPSRVREIGGLPGPLMAIAIVALIAWLCVAINYFVLLVIPGSGGPNRYGADPYGPDELERVFA